MYLSPSNRPWRILACVTDPGREPGAQLPVTQHGHHLPNPLRVRHTPLVLAPRRGVADRDLRGAKRHALRCVTAPVRCTSVTPVARTRVVTFSTVMPPPGRTTMRPDACRT